MFYDQRNLFHKTGIYSSGQDAYRGLVKIEGEGTPLLYPATLLTDKAQFELPVSIEQITEVGTLVVFPLDKTVAEGLLPFEASLFENRFKRLWQDLKQRF
ncbi:hypothetical protein WDW89_10400 [Deltaproteobacteria bacterium TL4]